MILWVKTIGSVFIRWSSRLTSANTLLTALGSSSILTHSSGMPFHMFDVLNLFVKNESFKHTRSDSWSSVYLGRYGLLLVIVEI